jgi:ETC complex I subunit conserved region
MHILNLRNFLTFFFSLFHFKNKNIQATGLTGLKVSPNPHYTLNALYGKILRAVAKMPQEAAYRKYTEQIINDRLKAVSTVRRSRIVIQNKQYNNNKNFNLILVQRCALPREGHRLWTG